MTMVAGNDPQLFSTSVVEDVQNHDDVVGVRLSYTYHDCFFTVHICNDIPRQSSPDQPCNPQGPSLRDFISRFNDACTWTENDKSAEHLDDRLDAVWQEAEDLVRAAAFGRIVRLGRRHGHRLASKDKEYVGHVNLSKHLHPKCFNLQVVIGAGGLDAVLRPDLPTHLPFAIEPDIAPQRDLPSIQARDIEVVKQLRPHVLKVRVGKSFFCCKLNSAGTQNTLLREYNILLQIRARLPTDLKVPRLSGTVIDGEGIVGILTHWVETQHPDLMALLVHQEGLPDSVRRNWADQILTTLKHLHLCNLVWGDVKTANVLIDISNHAWLIDFGGGFTRGWVDGALADTQAGDMQGFHNIQRELLGNKH